MTSPDKSLIHLPAVVADQFRIDRSEDDWSWLAFRRGALYTRFHRTTEGGK